MSTVSLNPFLIPNFAHAPASSRNLQDDQLERSLSNDLWAAPLDVFHSRHSAIEMACAALRVFCARNRSSVSRP